jgi:hypothetical protein
VHDLVLEGEDVFEVAIVALGPEVKAGCGVDQLRVDPDPVRSASDAAFEDVTNAEVLGDLPGRCRSSLVLKYGVTRGDEEARELRQVGDQILSQAIAEVFLLRVAGEVIERQNRDRGLVWRS